MAVLLGEHRLERCLAAADRVVALDAGAIAFDGAPGEFLDWALDRDPGAGHARRAAARAGRAAGAGERPRGAPDPAGGGPRAGRPSDPPAEGDVPGRAPREARVALAFRDLWVELGEGEERTEALRGVELRDQARRAGGADGPQRRRQEHAAAGGGRAGRAAARAASRRRAGWHCCPSGRATSSSTSGSATSCAATPGPRRLRRFGPRGAGGRRPPRPLRRRAPAPRAGHRRRRPRTPAEGSCPARCCWTSRPAAWTGPARASWRSSAGELAERGTAVMIATHDVEFAATFADRVVLLGRGRGGRRRLRGGAALGRLVLLERGRADPRRRRDHRRAGRRASCASRAGGVRAEGGGRSDLAGRRRCSVLAATLLGGFAWYERSRPPSQIVALVAALAAISVAGRVAFSPIPNVVPTTDIMLIAGLHARRGAGLRGGRALRPGLELLARPGALDALADGGLGHDRPARRLARGAERPAGSAGCRLAAVCAFAGFAYGALLDFSLMVTYGGEQSLDRYPGDLGARGALQHRPRGGQRRARAGRRAGDGADAAPLPAPLRVRLEAAAQPHRRPERAAPRQPPAWSPPC